MTDQDVSPIEATRVMGAVGKERSRHRHRMGDHLHQLNTILLDLRNIEVKIEDEDAALILLVSLPPSYENFMQSFIVGKDIVSLEEVRSSLHSRELRHKASSTGGGCWY